MLHKRYHSDCAANQRPNDLHVQPNSKQTKLRQALDQIVHSLLFAVSLSGAVEIVGIV
ncbi:hypothetical protein FHR74_002031 [Sphingomonas aerolata]|nr:hypothetical protein [Sphingomonas aerolata]